MAVAAVRKAAVLLASLPEPQAAALLAVLSPEQAAAVYTEARAITSIGREEQESLIQEIVGARPEKKEDAQPAELADASPLAFLDGASPEQLLAAIGDEHPQTIALVLSQLPAEKAAGLIAALSPRQQTSVVARIANIEEPGREIIVEIAEALRQRLAGPVHIPIGHGLTRLAKMLGAMRPATERKLLGGIAQADPELLQAIRRAIFGPDVAACAEAKLSAAS
jgi:flagellar motor switch protein FliG